MQIEYRQLSREEVILIRKIDRSETMDKFYIFRNGELVIEEKRFECTNEWFQNRCVTPNILPGLRKLVDSGGVVFGAFAGDDFVGIAALDPKFYNDNRLNLDIIFVSRRFRGKGIGRTLFKMIAREAQSLGASALYVSATPSKHTVDFYMDLGCSLVEEPDPVLFEKEPEDIHLELIF